MHGTDRHTITWKCAYRTRDRSYGNKERKRKRVRERERERKRKRERTRGMREYDISPIRPRHKRAICNAIVREHQCGERQKWRKVEW